MASLATIHEAVPMASFSLTAGPIMRDAEDQQTIRMEQQRQTMNFQQRAQLIEGMEQQLKTMTVQQRAQQQAMEQQRQTMNVQQRAQQINGMEQQRKTTINRQRALQSEQLDEIARQQLEIATRAQQRNN